MKLLKRALIFFENVLFPKCCLICSKYTKDILCKDCKNKIYKEMILKIDKNEEKYFKYHIYLFNYKDEIRNLILDYKFNDKSYLYKLFSEIIIKNKKMYGILKKYDIIIPVPIHKKRKRQRGYDQSKLIALELSRKIEKLKYLDAIEKVKNNSMQSKLSKQERIQNVKSVYKIVNAEKILNKKIILFDDIYTTGSTVNECAKILKQSGAKEILVLTIAKDYIKTHK